MMLKKVSCHNVSNENISDCCFSNNGYEVSDGSASGSESGIGDSDGSYE
jgi:hypothetical protein